MLISHISQLTSSPQLFWISSFKMYDNIYYNMILELHRYFHNTKKNNINHVYLQSLDMPTVRHFLNRQYWHRFLFNRITKHLPSLRHRYSICFCILRLKNPWNKWTNVQITENLASTSEFKFRKICGIMYILRGHYTFLFRNSVKTIFKKIEEI